MKHPASDQPHAPVHQGIRALSGAAPRLGALTKDLVNRWQQTHDSWRDDRAREFEARYIEELTSGVDKAMQVIDQLDRLLTRIRSECE